MGFSMTGYGRTELTKDGRQILVELKSLNGKNLETTLKLQSAFKPYETSIRTLVNNTLLRGTIECKMECKQENVSKPITINKPLATALYEEAKALSLALGETPTNLFTHILKMPDVVTSAQEVTDESLWPLAQEALQKALAQLTEHRRHEGESLMGELKDRVQSIQSLQKEIAPLEPARMQRIRQRITASLEDFFGAEKIDNNRLEQELIYYVEKIDFTEEQVRLEEHCRYFMDILQTNESLKGKKLGFVLQEIGREINTLGSKANDAAIQKIVINMKDELEKAKEQVLNLL